VDFKESNDTRKGKHKRSDVSIRGSGEWGTDEFWAWGNYTAHRRVKMGAQRIMQQRKIGGNRSMYTVTRAT